MGTIAELFSDERGLVWPDSIAPARVIIDRLGDSKETTKAADALYEGLGDKTFITTASGGSFSKYSHEFQTLSTAGEDTIYLDRNRKIAINKEVLTDEVIADLGLKREELEEVRAIE